MRSITSAPPWVASRGIARLQTTALGLMALVLITIGVVAVRSRQS